MVWTVYVQKQLWMGVLDLNFDKLSAVYFNNPDCENITVQECNMQDVH